MLVGDVIAGYRDSSYLYYPMFQWVDWQMQRGDFPLWMPYDNTGFPLLADGTSSLLYPGKAIFWFRGCTFAARYGGYLAVHVLLAAGGSYFLGTAIGAGRCGATLAAISYAFGGSVLFQVCNVVYLVSAAWLPWALICVWKMHQTCAKTSWAIAGSICCSMMILGGDPQMVYHVGLIALATTVTQTISSFRQDRSWLIDGWCGLFALVVLTSMLSAAQLLPTLEWARFSDRGNSEIPMTVYDGDFDSLVHLPDRPPVTDIYQFSQEPWAMLGLVFPNVFGSEAPVNTRWSAALPGAERIWAPSNYFGCLVLLLALTGISLRRKSTQERCAAGRVWLSWIAIWFVLASFGWYGIGWFLQELGVSTDAGGEGTFTQPVGGIYWLMVIALPKYCLFRYPAKLMVVGCLAMSVLAGLNLNRRGAAGLCRICFATAAISVAGIVGLFLPWTDAFLQSCETTTIFGPLDKAMCWKTMMLSFLSTLGCCGAAVGGMIALHRERHFRWLCGGLLLLVAIDLTLNNRWMLHPIDTKTMTQVTVTQEKIGRIAARQTPSFFSASAMGTRFDNESFYRSSSPDRVAELALWRREAMFPKMHLLIDNVQLWGSFTSIWPVAFDLINPSTIDFDARINCVDGEVKLEVRDASKLKGTQDPVKFLGWQGQTFHASLNQKNDAGIPYEIVLPILPVPGWEAQFMTAEIPSNTGHDADPSRVQMESVEMSAWGPLHSKAVVPDKFWGKSWDLRCVYRPASFKWGLILSGLSWIVVFGLTLRFCFKRLMFGHSNSARQSR